MSSQRGLFLVRLVLELTAAVLQSLCQSEAEFQPPPNSSSNCCYRSSTCTLRYMLKIWAHASFRHGDSCQARCNHRETNYHLGQAAAAFWAAFSLKWNMQSQEPWQADGQPGGLQQDVHPTHFFSSGSEVQYKQYIEVIGNFCFWFWLDFKLVCCHVLHILPDNK